MKGEWAEEGEEMVEVDEDDLDDLTPISTFTFTIPRVEWDARGRLINNETGK